MAEAVMESFKQLAADDQSIVVSYAPSNLSSRISQVLIQTPAYFVVQLCEKYFTLVPFKKGTAGTVKVPLNSIEHMEIKEDGPSHRISILCDEGHIELKTHKKEFAIFSSYNFVK